MYIFEISGILRIHLENMESFLGHEMDFYCEFGARFFATRAARVSGFRKYAFFGPTRNINPCRGAFLGDIPI